MTVAGSAGHGCCFVSKSPLGFQFPLKFDPKNKVKVGSSKDVKSSVAMLFSVTLV